MKIVIDALGLPLRGGARTSALGWLQALGQYGAEHHYDVFLSRPEPVLDQYPAIHQRLVNIENRFKLRIWAQWNLPRILKKERPDIFHAMKNLTVFGVPVPSVITINDLTHIVLADLFPPIDGVYWRVVQRLMLKQVDRIIAISDSTKQDLIKAYHLPADKVSVIYPACDPDFGKPDKTASEQDVRVKYDLVKPVILYVGGWAVHKNLPTLVKAFAEIAQQVPHQLVIVGGKHHTSSYTGFDALLQDARLIDRVKLLGTVPDEDLPQLYRITDLFVLPSLNEGFGLSLLEAMTCGAPALVSRSSSLPEVGGDCVAWVNDPRNITEWAEQLSLLLKDSDRREQLRQQGLAQAQKFNWRQTAANTLYLYDGLVRSVV